MAQVSCQVVQPKQARPSDGTLFINVELSPMACPSFEPGRMSDFGVEINRLLERCLKESRCLDTESLCIVSGEKVISLNSLLTCQFCMLFCRLLFFFLKKIISGISSECQTDWIQIRPHILFANLKGYRQTTLVGKELTLCILMNSSIWFNTMNLG